MYIQELLDFGKETVAPLVKQINDANVASVLQTKNLM